MVGAHDRMLSLSRTQTIPPRNYPAFFKNSMDYEILASFIQVIEAHYVRYGALIHMSDHACEQQ